MKNIYIVLFLLYSESPRITFDYSLTATRITSTFVGFFNDYEPPNPCFQERARRIMSVRTQKCSPVVNQPRLKNAPYKVLALRQRCYLNHPTLNACLRFQLFTICFRSAALVEAKQFPTCAETCFYQRVKSCRKLLATDRTLY